MTHRRVRDGNFSKKSPIILFKYLQLILQKLEP
jgi:hypothetical protein